VKANFEEFESRGLPWNADDIPEVWEISSLNNVLDSLRSGFACGRNQQVSEGLAHLRPMNISPDGRIDLSDCRFVPHSFGEQRLRAGDILFNNTNSPPWVGKTAWISPEYEGLAFSNHMTQVRVKDTVSSKFFALQIDWLRRASYFYVNCNKHVNQASISGDFLRKKMPILVPPLPEQKRIADKLEAVLGRVDACRARLARVPGLLKRFRQSVLAAATSGRLTENPEMVGWKHVPFEELLADKRKLSYGVLKPGDNDPSGVPMYRIVDIGEWGKGSDTQPSYISKSLSKEFDRTVIEKGDILLSVMATIGRAMVASEEMVGANVNRAIAVIKPDTTQVNSHYLNYYFLSPSLVREFEERSIGSAQVRINLTDLRRFTMNLPPLEEQREIVRHIETLFAYADRIEYRLANSQAAVDRLTPATLAKAFRGELVPQDPNDEPASSLLAHIRAERAREDSKPKKRKSKPATKMKKLTLEGLKQTINKLPNDTFGFDELSRSMGADYDQLSTLLMKLLGETKPPIKQVFDATEKTMRLHRIAQ
jgi:type I restriction enzyme S subunit